LPLSNQYLNAARFCFNASFELSVRIPNLDPGCRSFLSDDFCDKQQASTRQCRDKLRGVRGHITRDPPASTNALPSFVGKHKNPAALRTNSPLEHSLCITLANETGLCCPQNFFGGGKVF
jgi:hypothetical protein